MNVLVIKNRLIDRKEVIADFKLEGYNHNFTFSDDISPVNEGVLNNYDEIWTYGDVKADILFKLVKKNNNDFWVMK